MTLFISAINKREKNAQIHKTIIVYIVLAVAAVIFDQIYALFGHGVRASAMSLMFLYPLLGGALFYFIAPRFLPGLNEQPHFRVFYNMYNSGIAILTTGSLLKGILDIAGTASAYVPLYFITGWTCITAGLCLFGFGYRQVLHYKRSLNAGSAV